ncbi:hypothetical protein K2173_005565 [Erythroxylum novogranatense]|uniref:SBP-type domain-containing protein n=1 Tax=Erythroxylum novogranatense TaxID=1862640 RepID=A0AAV8SK73_9ROSI|nr:hypothetical protein K2173_005565 [Erythroxylum novogranatense]
MDWKLKAGSWDLSEFEQEAVSKMDVAAFDRPNMVQDYRVREDCSIDLRLGEGGSNSSEDSINRWKQQPPPSEVSKVESSTSGSTKRARGAGNGTQVVSCLVDGCKANLSCCRDYHRRHKVCELHSKSPQVTIGGQKQRFCQQCSRFHSPEEFDEGKRSCRKRLDGHNRRRRKPQPDPLSYSGSFFCNYQGSQLLTFSGSHAYPSTTVVNSSWIGAVNTETISNGRHFNFRQQIQLPDKQSLFLGSSLNTYKEGKKFLLLEPDNPNLGNQPTPEPSICQPLLTTFSLAETSGGTGNHAMFFDNDRLATRVRDSDCALSLLSSSRMRTPVNHILQPDSLHNMQPLDQCLHVNTLDPMEPVFVSHSRDAHDVDCSGMFQMRPGDSTRNKVSHALPFTWE